MRQAVGRAGHRVLGEHGEIGPATRGDRCASVGAPLTTKPDGTDGTGQRLATLNGVALSVDLGGPATAAARRPRAFAPLDIASLSLNI
ncbi:MAG: hypothetical protein ACJ76L_09925 [Conexibacter sp.]